jgi:hypothetical protein
MGVYPFCEQERKLCGVFASFFDCIAFHQGTFKMRPVDLLFDTRRYYPEQNFRILFPYLF